MALHYILDGYNIIKCVDAWADCSLEEGRKGLLHMINYNRPQGSARNKVTVVFDGKDDVWGPQAGGLAKVVFSAGQSADDYIKHAVESDQRRLDIVVVSNDKEIVCYVRRLGAKVVSVEKFMSFLHPSNARHARENRRSENRSKVIGRALEYKINKEFEKIWLEKK